MVMGINCCLWQSQSGVDGNDGQLHDGSSGCLSGYDMVQAKGTFATH